MRARALLVLAVAGLPLAGCYTNPYRNPGDWIATGASRENLAQQAAYKSDLIEGRGDTYSSGVAASAAVDKALGGAAGNASGLQTAPPSLVTTVGG